MTSSEQFAAIPLPSSYGKLPGIPGIPNHPELHGYINAGERISGLSFTDTMGAMLRNSNDLMGKPEELTIKAVHTGQVDIHEVMIAMGKADIAFKLITAVSQKMVSAFEKLSSMQV